MTVRFSMKPLLCLCLLALSLPALPMLAARNDSTNPATRRVAFSQHCFWTGEMKLGQIDGVKRTEAGFFKGREVTLVEYDPSQITLEKLADAAKHAGVGDQIHLSIREATAGSSISGVKVGTPLDASYRTAPASDQKKQLEGTPYARLTLTPEQATKVNAFARSNPAKAREWLAPEQRARLAASR